MISKRLQVILSYLMTAPQEKFSCISHTTRKFAEDGSFDSLTTWYDTIKEQGYPVTSFVLAALDGLHCIAKHMYMANRVTRF